MTWHACRSLLAVAATVLLLAPAAGAKGSASLEICGADGCRSIHAAGDRPGANAKLVFGVLDEATASTSYTHAPAPAPFYTLEVRAEGLDLREPQTYVPRRSALSQGTSWVAVRPTLARSLERATAGLTPTPAPTVRRATVAGVAVADPTPYARLLELPPTRARPAPQSPYVEIALRGDRVSPWTDPRRPLRFFVHDELVQNGPDWRHVPPDLAATVARDLTAAGRHERDRGLASISTAALLAGGLLLVAWMTLARARRAAARRAPRPSGQRRPRARAR